MATASVSEKQKQTTIQNGEGNLTLHNHTFPALPLFLISSLLFLDFGILMGALNSFRFGGHKFLGYTIAGEIHQTHWTSTLLGGVSIIMLGQIYFFFSLLAEERKWWHGITIPVLLIWLAGVFASFLSVWSDPRYDSMVNGLLKLSSGLFGILIFAFFIDPKFRENVKQYPSIWYLVSAVFWFEVAMFRFDIANSSLDRLFLFTYIYGFFSLALFGSLSIVLPVLFKQKRRTRFSVFFNIFLLNLAAAVIIIDLYLKIEMDKDIIVFDILGPFLWGLAGFIFILYVADMIYKNGFDTSLLALTVSLMMFGFFVFDTFIKNLFPNWVQDKSHFHFLFIGTLLITIIAIGTRLVVHQQSPALLIIGLDNKVTFSFKFDKIRMTGIVITIISVGLILLGFTFGWYQLSGWSGIALLLGLIMVELTMVGNIITGISKNNKSKKNSIKG